MARYRPNGGREGGRNGVLGAIEGWQLIELNYRSTIAGRADVLLHAVGRIMARDVLRLT